MSNTDKHGDVISLLRKGDGVLTRRGNVWSYPGSPNDLSGTNVVLPMEHVSDVAVQAALADGVLRAAVVAPSGHVSAVRHIEDETTLVRAGLAGTAELGTELPPNSRVSHDAGMVPTSSADAEKQASEALRATVAKPATAESARKPDQLEAKKRDR